MGNIIRSDSIEGKKVLSEIGMQDYSAIERIVDTAANAHHFIQPMLVPTAKGLVLLGIGYVLGGCHDLTQAPAAPDAKVPEEQSIYDKTKGEVNPEENKKKETEAPPEDIKDMDEHRKAEDKRKTEEPVKDKEKKPDYSVPKKDDKEEPAKPEETPLEEKVKKDTPKPEEKKEEVVEKKADPKEEVKPEEPKTPEEVYSGPSITGNPKIDRELNKLIRERGTRVIPRLSELIDSGRFDWKHPNYGIDDHNTVKTSVSLKGEAGLSYSDISERASINLKPFSADLFDVRALDSLFLNMFLRNTNSLTRRHNLADLTVRDTEVEIDVGARINEFVDYKNAIIGAGLTLAYQNVMFADRDKMTPRVKSGAQLGVFGFFEIPDLKMGGILRYKGAVDGAWESQRIWTPSGDRTIKGHYQFHELYAEFHKRFKKGWHVGADTLVRHEEFKGVPESNTQLYATLMAGKNNIHKGIDLMLALTYAGNWHQTHGDTHSMRLAAYGSIPLHTLKDGQEVLVLRPFVGVGVGEFPHANGISGNFYTGIELVAGISDSIKALLGEKK
jgi:hypothetical protein